MVTLADARRIIAAAEKKAAEILTQIRDLPIVSVGDDERFLRRGGVICFVPEDARLKFEINLGTATRLGLAISSKLLGLAKVVVQRS